MTSLHGPDVPPTTVIPRGLQGPYPSNHPLRKQAAIPPAQTLPFDYLYRQAAEAEKRGSIPTVKTTPRHPPPRLRPRIFGLEECPTFYPNEEEFADPLKYIEYISSPEGGNGREYGIIKIVPPEGWQLPFVLDQGVSDRLTLRMHQC